MALLFTESFEAVSNTTMLPGWSAIDGSNTTVTSGNQRTGSRALRLQTSSGAPSMSRSIPNTPNPVIVGFGFRHSALADTRQICELRQGANTHITLELKADGSVRVLGPTGAVLGTSATGLLQSNVYAYIEVKLNVHDTTGSVAVQINGVQVLNLTNVDTRNNSGSAYSDTLVFRHYGTFQGTTDYDDLYCADTTGSNLNDFAGDCTVQCLRPSGAGSATGWTPSAGSNYQCVDDAQPNDDTDYVSASVAGTKDLYALGNLTVSTGVVRGVQVCARIRKDDAGLRQVCQVLKSGGTEQDQASYTPSTSYGWDSKIVETDPNGGIAWTRSAIDALEVGPKVTA